MKRAEAFFRAKKWTEAVALYRSLLDEARFRGQAGCRLVQIFVDQGQSRQALKVLSKLTELEEQNQWLLLADQIVRLGNVLPVEASP